MEIGYFSTMYSRCCDNALEVDQIPDNNSITDRIIRIPRDLITPSVIIARKITLHTVGMPSDHTSRASMASHHDVGTIKLDMYSLIYNINVCTNNQGFHLRVTMFN